MPKKRESLVHEAILRWIKAHCPESEVEKRHGSMYTVYGDPDLTGCIQGYHVEIEVKKPGGELRKAQAIRLRKYLAAGAIAGVAESVEDAKDIIIGSGKIRIVD